MYKTIATLILGAVLVKVCTQTPAVNATNQNQTNNNNAMSDTNKIVKTDEEWKNILTPQQYNVIIKKGTEPAFSGTLLENKEKGMYVCAACGNELFSSDMKFDSHCGWPSFDKEIAGGKIITKTDSSFGMARTEIMCAKCGGHLGHLFDDGPTETGMRYCVNSLSLDFKADSTKTK